MLTLQPFIVCQGIGLRLRGHSDQMKRAPSQAGTPGESGQRTSARRSASGIGKFLLQGQRVQAHCHVQRQNTAMIHRAATVTRSK
jgi:hypothetical protein